MADNYMEMKNRVFKARKSGQKMWFAYRKTKDKLQAACTWIAETSYNKRGLFMNCVKNGEKVFTCADCQAVQWCPYKEKTGVEK